MLCRLGAVELSAVTEEAPEYANTITTHAVEKGQDVSDHVKVQQSVLNISGVVTGDDAPHKLSILLAYRNTGEIIGYTGRTAFGNVVIENLSTRHHARIRDGFEFDIVLRQIKIAESREVQIAAPGLGSQVNEVENAGLQQPQNA